MVSAVGQIARLRHRRHHEMHFDEPDDELGVGGVEPEPRRQAAREAAAGDRMILDAALGDVVQEQRDAEHGIMLRLDGLDQIAGEAEFRILAARDLIEHADAADQMLVHRIVVIHVELHHRHDPAEGMDESAEHAGFVHPPQHDLGGVLRCQDFQEQPVGFLVLAHLLADELERMRDDPHRFRVESEIVLLRQMENPDQVDRIAAEHVGARDIDAVIVDDEVVGLADLFARRRRAPLRSAGSTPAPASPAGLRARRRGWRSNRRHPWR